MNPYILDLGISEEFFFSISQPPREDYVLSFLPWMGGQMQESKQPAQSTRARAFKLTAQLR